jgi:hypothetical protein
MVEWPENISISDAEPSDYVPRVRSRFTGEDWAAMQKFHALPDGWENMNYQDFLAARRGLMAGIIRKGYESLK